jgi:Tfp pilus assembly protein PilF
MQLAMHDQAITALRKALQVDNTSGLAYYNLACVYARMGESTTATHYLQQALEFEPQARIWAQTDADFTRVRTTPEFQQLLGPL